MKTRINKSQTDDTQCTHTRKFSIVVIFENSRRGELHEDEDRTFDPLFSIFETLSLKINSIDEINDGHPV